MKAEADDGQGERERAESRDEQTPEMWNDATLCMPGRLRMAPSGHKRQHQRRRD
jgi:hypothetical protein